jgi:hypothetical protein
MARQGEASLSDAIRDALAYEPGLTLWRNSQCAVVKSNRMVRGGLGNGSADLVGLLAVKIDVDSHGRLEHFGDKIGRFVALEVKMPGEIPCGSKLATILAVGATGHASKMAKADKHILEQEEWLQSVRARGGFAAYVDSVESAKAAIQRARSGYDG